MAASHPGPSVPAVARQSALGAGAAPSSPDLCPADQQTGGTVEGRPLKCLPPKMLSVSPLVGRFFWPQDMLPFKNSYFKFMYLIQNCCL